MTLPTRDEAQAVVDEFAKYGIVTGSKDAATSVELDCLSARANGELLSRAEWEATIDRESVLAAVYEAGRPWTTTDGDMQTSDKTWAELVNVAVDAALGIGETLSVTDRSEA